MSHFILHKKWMGKKVSCLLAAAACFLAAGVFCYVAHNMGTARAKSRETVLIYTEEEFEQYLLDTENEDYNLGGRYRLEEDLELSWLYQSIGTNLEPFTGSLDGNGHVISGLTRPLFGVVEGAEIENLFLGDTVIQNPFTYYDGEKYVDGYGALAAYVVDSVIRNCGMGGRIEIASPSEAEYLLEKASPSDAEEEQGPGVREPAGPPVSEEEKTAEVGPGVETEDLMEAESGVETSGEAETTDGSAAIPEESGGETELSQEPEESKGLEEETGETTAGPAETGTDVSAAEPEKTTSQAAEAEDLSTEEAGGNETENRPAEAPGAEIPPADSLETGNSQPETQPEQKTQTEAPKTDTPSGNQEAETVALLPVIRQQLTKTSTVAEHVTGGDLTATPSDAEAEKIPMASSSNAEESDKTEKESTREVSVQEDHGENEWEYIGSPAGDVYILVTAECITAGGLISETAGVTQMTGCFAFTTITAQEPGVPSRVGGLAGILGEGSRTENSYTSGLIDVSDVAGGFAAANHGVVQNSFTSMVIGDRGTTRGAFTALEHGELYGCVYDRQMAGIEGENLEETGEFSLLGLDTARLSGIESCIPGNWYRAEQAYPQLEYFAASGNESISACSKLSAIALVLPQGMSLKDVLTGEDGLVLPAAIDGEEIQWEAEGPGFIDEENRIQTKILPEFQVSVSGNEAPRVGTSLEKMESGAEKEENNGGETSDSETDNEEPSKIQLKATLGSLSRTYTLNAAARAAEIENYTTWKEVGEKIYNDAVSVYTPTLNAEGYYEIKSVEALAWFSYVVNNVEGYTSINGKLMNDLDLSAAVSNWSTTAPALEWVPIGGSNAKPYTGTFDGGGHRINHLTMNGTDDGVAVSGLFGYISGNTIKGIILEHAAIDTSGKESAGGIAGMASGGALITECGIESGFIKGNIDAGGIAYQMKDSTVERCYNKAAISISATQHAVAGGIVGRFATGSAIQCYNQGNVTIPGDYDTWAGGIGAYGYPSFRERAESCYNTGQIKGGSGKKAIIDRGKTTNSYCLTGSGVADKGVTPVEDAALRSWYLVFKLNGGTLDGGYQYNAGGYPSFGHLEYGDWEKIGEGLEFGLLPAEHTKPEAGNGSLESPYQLETAEQLAWFQYQVNHGNPGFCATLMNDIDLRGSAYGGGPDGTPLCWIPIGTSTDPYTGTFDGNGKLISYMNVEHDGAAGFFGYVGGGATIRNLGLAPSGSVKNTSAEAGAAAAEAGTAAFVGAVVRAVGTSGTASTDVTIESCYNRASVSGVTGSKTGAFVGSCAVSDVQKITNSYNTGLVTAGSGAPGAIAGSFAPYDGGTGSGIAHCFWNRETSAVSGSLSAVSGGGITVKDTDSLSTADMNTSAADTAMLPRLNTDIPSGSSWRRGIVGDGSMNDGYPILWDGYESWENVGMSASSKPALKTPLDTGTAGQASNPYQITTAAELAWFAYQVNHVDGQDGICGELKADISLFGEQYTGSTYLPGDSDGLSRALNWIPAGTMTTKPYTGTFQGNGHTVSDMRVQGTLNMVSAGLFGSIGTGAVVCDLALFNGQISITGDHTGVSGAAGGIAGMIEGNGAVLERCRNTGNLMLTRTDSSLSLAAGGGIVGGIDSSAVDVRVKSCWNTGTVSNGVSRSTGGIVGESMTSELEMEGCYTTTESRIDHPSSPAGQNTGGIIGWLGGNAGGTKRKIKNCYNWGIVGGKEAAGGIIGRTENSLPDQTITSCYNTGKVTAGTGNYKGAIIGRAADANGVGNCYYDKTLWGSMGGGDGIHGMGLSTEVLKSWSAAYALNGQKRNQGTGVDVISWNYDPTGTNYPTLTTEGLLVPEDWGQIGEGLAEDLITTSWSGTAWTKPGSTAATGDGSSGNPYQLTSAEDLAWFAYLANTVNGGACAVLKSDMDLFGKGYIDFSGNADIENIDNALAWKPITGSGLGYTGTFDGAGHSIRNMRVIGAGNLGLVGTLGTKGVIRNVGLASGKVTSSGGTHAAGLIGYVTGGNARVWNCWNNAAVVGSVTNGAGIVGGGDHENGLVIEHCYNLGEVAITGESIGGILGKPGSGSVTVQDCYNQGKIAGSGANAGGIAGAYGGGVVIKNCYNRGKITSDVADGAHAVLGKGDASAVRNSYYDSETSGTGDPGADGLSSMEMKGQRIAASLNTLDGVLRTGIARVWYTSLNSEETAGYPTFQAPTVVTVEFAADTPVEGSSMTLKDSDGNPVAIADMKLRSFGSVDSTFTPGSMPDADADFFLAPYTGTTGVTGADSKYHKYGYINANKYLGFLAGTTDLNGKTASLNAASLTVPVDVGLGNVTSVSLGRAAAYTKPEDRYVLLEAASGSSRCEIQMVVKGVTGKMLSVTMPIKVTMEKLTPDGTDHTVSNGTAGYSADLSIVNHNACPIQGRVLGVEVTEDSRYAGLHPVLPSYTLSHTGLLTDAAGGVRLGIADVESASPPVIGGPKYYDKDAAPGTSWMEYSLKYEGSLSYRYVMEYSGMHFGPKTEFQYKIDYWFGVPADDYESSADAVVTS